MGLRSPGAIRSREMEKERESGGPHGPGGFARSLYLKEEERGTPQGEHDRRAPRG